MADSETQQGLVPLVSKEEKTGAELIRDVLTSVTTHLQSPEARTLQYPPRTITGSEGGRTTFTISGFFKTTYSISVAGSEDHPRGFTIAQGNRNKATVVVDEAKVSASWERAWFRSGI